jgi:hypothetical protein
MRIQIPKKVRFEVFKRDAFVCQYCGSHPPSVILHVDHIHPVSKGGENNIDNLITACEACNLGKGAGLLSGAPKSLKEKALEVSEREEQLKGYSDVLRKRAERLENEAWEVAEVLMCKSNLESYNRENLLSIKRFLERLPLTEVLEAAEIAVIRMRVGSSSGFKYFCGVCWAKIREAENVSF